MFLHFISLLFIAFIFLVSGNTSAEEIICEGTYEGGHLQGIAVDDDGKAVFWAHTGNLVKTDMQGHVLKAIPVIRHHGDLTYCDGKVYVAVNHGMFNREPGQADSWVYIYDANDLTLISKKQLPELVYGAGGIGHHNNTFIVIGGLPPGHNENYAYEYDENFDFVKRHTLNTGYTYQGIQTVCYAHGCWWFGCYARRGSNKPLYKTDDKFIVRGAYNTYFPIGIAVLPDGRFLQGVILPPVPGSGRGKVEILDAAPLIKIGTETGTHLNK